MKYYILVLILIFVLKLWFDGSQVSNHIYDLNKDGVSLIKNIFNENEIKKIKK